MPSVLNIEHIEVRRILNDFSLRASRYLPWTDVGLTPEEKAKKMQEEVLKTGEELRKIGFLKDESPEQKKQDAILPELYYKVIERRAKGELDNVTTCRQLRRVVVNMAVRLHNRHFTNKDTGYKPNTRMNRAEKVFSAYQKEPPILYDLPRHQARLAKLGKDIQACGFGSLQEFLSSRRDFGEQVEVERRVE